MSIRLYKQKTADLFKIFAIRNRIEILKILAKGESSVNRLSSKLKLSQPVISQHLRILRAHNLVKFTRKGTSLLYQIDKKNMIFCNKRIDDLFKILLKPKGRGE